MATRRKAQTTSVCNGRLHLNNFFKKIGDLNLPHFYLIGNQKYCKTFLTRLCLLARLFQNVPTRQKVCKMKIGARNNVIKWRLHQLLLEGYLRHFRGEH